MKTKLMFGALLFCSSLSFAGGDLSTAPSTVSAKKKPMKRVAPSTAVEAQPLSGLETAGLGTGSAAPKKLRGTAPAPTK